MSPAAPTREATLQSRAGVLERSLSASLDAYRSMTDDRVVSLAITRAHRLDAAVLFDESPASLPEGLGARAIVRCIGHRSSERHRGPLAHEPARFSVLDDLRYAAARERKYRSSHRQRFEHRQTERLV